MTAAAPSLLEHINPSLLLGPLASPGTWAGLWLLLAGVWMALGALRSPRGSAWVGSVGVLTLVFLQITVKEGADSPWFLAALAGTSLLIWVVLTPLFTRFAKLLAPLLCGIAALALLSDVATWMAWRSILIATPKAAMQSPWMPAAFGMWQLIAFALLFGVLVGKGQLLKPWFRSLALAHVGGSMMLHGFSHFSNAWNFGPFHLDPLPYLTATTAAVLASFTFAKGWPSREDLLERYQPYKIVAATHIFLICFTLITLYPVLWVIKMAVTPQQGFILGINPVPQPLVQYVNAWRRGDTHAAGCYKRAMAQNFREVMGQGSACTDQICGQWRQHNDRWLVARRHNICGAFARIWSASPKLPRPPPTAAQSPSDIAAWNKAALRKWRGKQFATWRTGIVKQRTGALKTSTNKLLTEIVHKQRERNAHGSLFWRQVLNSLLVAFVTTLLGMFLACTAAYAFSRFRFPGRRMGLMSFLVSQMFPGTLMMIPLYILISRLGLLNSLMGLTLVYSTTSIPFCVWMLKGYFDTIPKELEEAALIDGASRTLIFWKIMLPLARPAIAVTALFSFMTAWNEFILAVTFMNDKTSFTLPVMLRQYVGSHNTEWGHFAAGAVLVSLPIVLLFFLLQKNLVGGLTAGSVKG